MSELEEFRELLRETLTLTALDIFGKFEKKLTKYQEEISRSKQERKKIQHLLNIVKKPALKLLHQTDVQHPPLLKPPQIKEEQDLWTNQEEEKASKLEFSNVQMSKFYMREFVGERLTAAASEILGAFELTFAEYQEEISRSEEERKRLQRWLDIWTQPKIKIHRIDVQHLSLLEPPQIKEEEKLWTNQEEEKLQGLQAETTDSIFTSLSVKQDWDQKGFSECPHQDQAVQVDNREEDSLPSNTAEEQIEAEPHVQDCAAPEPVSDSQPLSVVAPDCPAAQRLEEHGAEMFLQETISSTITQVYSAVPGGKMFQASSKGVKVHQCTVCSKMVTNGSLARHMRTHTGEKSHQCQECGKRFSEKFNLVQHMRTHTGEEPYQCQECDKRFRFRSQIVKHMRTHTGEKPYQCQECTSRFFSRSHLISHEWTHSGEKPYQCQRCRKQFVSKCTLSRHLRTHTTEKSHQCQECSKQFREKFNLVEHMRTHTGEEPYQCQVQETNY